MNAIHPIMAAALAPHIDFLNPQRAPAHLDMPTADIEVQFELTADGPDGKHWLADLSATVTICRGMPGEWQAETVKLHTLVAGSTPRSVKDATYEVSVGRHAPGHPIAELALIELMQPRHAARIEEALAKAECEWRSVA